MSEGYVYILSNPSMPGLVKIGRTTRSVEGRANELYQTGVPEPFKVEHEVIAPNCADLETGMHEVFAADRVSPGREFFRVCPLRAARQLDAMLKEQVSEFVERFLPSHTLVSHYVSVDDGHIYYLANDLDMDPANVTMAIERLHPEDLRPAIERLNMDKAKMAAARLATIEHSETPEVLQ